MTIKYKEMRGIVDELDTSNAESLINEVTDANEKVSKLELKTLSWKMS